MSKREELTGLTLIAALLALLAVPTVLGPIWQIGLGLVTFVTAVYLTALFFNSEYKKLSVIFLIMAILFNPIFVVLQLFTMTVFALVLAFTLFGVALYLSNSN